jgi:hypothetical protein
VTTSADALSENDVVDAVCSFLVASGYSIQQRRLTTETGDDVRAARSSTPALLLSIEAKGATSARATSVRFGKPFDSAQVRVHVAEAVFKAVQVLSRPDEDAQAGIALPDNRLHRNLVATVQPILDELGVVLFWVGGDRTVTTVGHLAGAT